MSAVLSDAQRSTRDVEEEEDSGLEDEGDVESSLLNIGEPPKPHAEHVRKDYKMIPKGRLRAYWLGIVVCIGGFLFGYDSGIIGGVLTLESYQNSFRYGEDDATHVSSLAVGLQQLGAFVACFAIWPVTHKLGRKRAIAICSFIFVTGALIQTINTHNLSAFYTGRILAGVGLGGSSVVVPMFSSEMTPKEIRGQVGSFYQLMFTFGIFTSYWIDYGVAKDLSDSNTRQWEIPIGLQVLFAGLLGLGMLTLKESVRWLTQKGRHEEAWESLKWIRASDGEDAQLEMEEIRMGVKDEAHASEGFHLKEMLQRDNASRTLTAVLVFTAQQATGATAFAYFGPQYFQLLVGKSGNTDLLLTAIFGAVKVAACLCFVIFVAERVSRKGILTAGALFMAACQITTAAVVKTHPAPEDPHITSSGIATIALIYLFVIAYNLSWGPLPWPYVSEIFPTRTREPGVAIGVASQWLLNFIFSLTTPYMIKNLAWGTFLLWGCFDIAIALYSWFGLIETKQRSLEDIARSSQGSAKAGYVSGGSDGRLYDPSDRFSPGILQASLEDRLAQQGQIANGEVEQKGERKRVIVDLALQEYRKLQTAEHGQKMPADGMDASFKKAAIKQIRAFIFDGHDKTSSTICNAVYLLSKNQECLARIREEHDDVLGPVANTPRRIKDNPYVLNKLEYTQAVIRETLRLFPVASSTRTGFPGYKGRDPKTGEALETENMLVWALHFPLHRDEDVWGRPYSKPVPALSLHAGERINTPAKRLASFRKGTTKLHRTGFGSTGGTNRSGSYRS